MFVIFNKIFNNIFENCVIHDLKHTKMLYQKEFNQNFDKTIEIDSSFPIKSGSVAQVYKIKLKNTNTVAALKVTHPEVNQQILFPYLYLSLYNRLINSISYLNKFKLPFDIMNFLNNMYLQLDMVNEANNLNYFYNNYIDNPLIIIPKPLQYSKNILIMDYIEGKQFEETDCSEYTRYKILILLNIFFLDSMFTLDKFHGDLHNGNWKIILKNNEHPKIILYDFGYCINKDNNIIEFRKACDTNNLNKFGTLLYNYILFNPLNITKLQFVDQLNEYVNTNNISLWNINSANKIISFFIKKNVIFKSVIFEILLSMSLLENYFRKYVFVENPENNIIILDKETYRINRLNTLKDQTINYITFCKTYNIFKHLTVFFEEYLKEINNEIYILNKNNRKNTKNKNIIEI
tara:strand:+ start:4644 stop:5858 length:1215 start_codon:yes stop_codon:yes gene_type:complete